MYKIQTFKVSALASSATPTVVEVKDLTGATLTYSLKTPGEVVCKLETVAGYGMSLNALKAVISSVRTSGSQTDTVATKLCGDRLRFTVEQETGSPFTSDVELRVLIDA